MAGSETAVRERPIPFSASMVDAILDQRKTVTRRVVKPQPNAGPYGVMVHLAAGDWGLLDGDLSGEWRCPYGNPGDRLYVKERWRYADWTEDGEPYVQYGDESIRLIERIPEDWADRLADVWANLSSTENYAIDNRAADRRWRSSRFMPRWASRITLEVVSVRVERLQEITEEDCFAEGVQIPCTEEGRPLLKLSRPFLDLLPEPRNPLSYSGGELARAYFADLWQSINDARPGCSWNDSPWVWRIEFRRVS